MKEYDWTGLFRGQNAAKKAAAEAPSSSNAPKKNQALWYKVLAQFTPQTYDAFNWNILEVPNSIISCGILIIPVVS